MADPYDDQECHPISVGFQQRKRLRVQCYKQHLFFVKLFFAIRTAPTFCRRSLGTAVHFKCHMCADPLTWRFEAISGEVVFDPSAEQQLMCVDSP